MLNSKASNEDLLVDYFKINSKLGGYTHCVHLRCTQRRHEISEKNAKLKSEAMKTFESIISNQFKYQGIMGDGYPLGPHEHENASGATQQAPF